MKPKQHTIEEFAKLLAKVLKSDRDAMICVSGFTGEGKSTLAANLALALSKVLKTEFSFEKNMTYRRDEFVNLVDGENRLKQYSVILVDEIVSLFNRRNWMKKGQKGTLELLEKCRDRHLIMIGNAPTFWNLDNQLIHSKTRFWIHVHKRGYAWIFVPIKNPFTRDKWQRERNEKLYRIGGMNSVINAPNSNFLGSLIFKDLDKETKKTYLKFRNQKRKDTESQDEEVEKYATSNNRCRKVIYYSHHEGGIPQKDLVKWSGYTQPQVSNILSGNLKIE